MQRPTQKTLAPYSPQIISTTLLNPHYVPKPSLCPSPPRCWTWRPCVPTSWTDLPQTPKPRHTLKPSAKHLTQIAGGPFQPQASSFTRGSCSFRTTETCGPAYLKPVTITHSRVTRVKRKPWNSSVVTTSGRRCART